MPRKQTNPPLNLHYDDLPRPKKGQLRDWIISVHLPHLFTKLECLANEHCSEALCIKRTIQHQLAVIELFE